MQTQAERLALRPIVVASIARMLDEGRLARARALTRKISLAIDPFFARAQQSPGRIAIPQCHAMVLAGTRVHNGARQRKP